MLVCSVLFKNVVNFNVKNRVHDSCVAVKLMYTLKCEIRIDKF